MPCFAMFSWSTVSQCFKTSPSDTLPQPCSATSPLPARPWRWVARRLCGWPYTPSSRRWRTCSIASGVSKMFQEDQPRVVTLVLSNSHASRKSLVDVDFYLISLIYHSYRFIYIIYNIYISYIIYHISGWCWFLDPQTHHRHLERIGSQLLCLLRSVWSHRVILRRSGLDGHHRTRLTRGGWLSNTTIDTPL